MTNTQYQQLLRIVAEAYIKQKGGKKDEKLQANATQRAS